MVNVEQPTKGEFEEWKLHPVTKNFFNNIFLRREQIKEELIYSGTDQHTEDIYRKGYCKALQHILEVDFYEPQEVIDDSI